MFIWNVEYIEILNTDTTKNQWQLWLEWKMIVFLFLYLSATVPIFFIYPMFDKKTIPIFGVNNIANKIFSKWELPSNMECFTKEGNTHKGSNDNPNRLEHGNKYRSFPIYAPSQYRKVHCTSENSLQYCFHVGMSEHCYKPSMICNFCLGWHYMLTE